jgi:hypothetical protein
MTPLTATTTAGGTSKGTRLAAALDQRLAGDKPLLEVVAWYATQHYSVLSIDERLGLEGNADSSDIETAAIAVHISQSNPRLDLRTESGQSLCAKFYQELETRSINTGGHQSWVSVARNAYRQAQPPREAIAGLCGIHGLDLLIRSEEGAEHVSKTRSILRRACRGGIDLYADRQVFRNDAYFSTVPQWARVPTSTPSSPVGSHYLSSR